MILRRRSHESIPLTSDSYSSRRRVADAASIEYFRLPVAQRRREKFEFDDSILTDLALVNALFELFLGLCGVCESRLTRQRFAVHRWRPAEGAVSASGDTSAEHYYWLAYEWSNLYALCQPCSEAKGRKFPVQGSLAQVGAKDSDLLEELPILLDPCVDDAEQSLVYHLTGEVVARDERGWATIDIFALNRRELIEQRRFVAEEADVMSRKILRALDRDDHLVLKDLLTAGYSADSPFAAVKRQFVNQRVQTRRVQIRKAMYRLGLSLEELVGNLPRVTDKILRDMGRERGLISVGPTSLSYAVDRSSSYAADRTGLLLRPEAVGVRTVGISRVKVENFKGLEHLELQLESELGAGSWTMLIGENGVGKTSVLQAIALALAGPEVASGMRLSSKSLTRKGARAGSSTVELNGTGGLCTLEFSRSGRMQYASPYPVAVAAYGATRLPHTASARRTAYATGAIENLFDPHASLLSPERWAPDLDLDRRASVLRAVQTALRMEGDDLLYFTRGGNLRIKRGDTSLDFRELSSGYQAVGALVLDLARIFIDKWDSLEAAEGLVLIDEIETHLHPRWQMQVVASLRAAFPRVQFVATTHSPLCLRGLRRGEVRVLRSSPSGQTWIDDDLPSVQGLSADQLLTSEHFGLYSTLDEKMQSVYERYYQLISTRVLKPSEREELQRLQVVLGDRRQFGSTRREKMMYHVIDNFLAREESAVTRDESERLERSAYADLTRIWESLDA